MKLFIMTTMLCLLAGCAQQNHFPPDISGKLQPVNSAKIIQEIGNV